MLQGSKREALLAVDLYSRAASKRSLEGFVVDTHMAWLYLDHAKFLSDKIDYRYRKEIGHFVRVDGEIKTWELARSLGDAFASDTSAVRANAEFVIRIGNKDPIHGFDAMCSSPVVLRDQLANSTTTRYLLPRVGVQTEER